MKKSTAILSAIGAFAAGAVASLYAVKHLVRKETGRSLDDILTENEEVEVEDKDVQEILSAVAVASEAAPDIAAAVEAIQEANAAEASDAEAPAAEAPAAEAPAEDLPAPEAETEESCQQE